MRIASQKWGDIWIITCTIFGGILEFYVMHRLETNYKNEYKWLRYYEAELKMKKDERVNELEGSSKFI
ncbi:hypothetical protein AAZX31_05G087200 [Glycine max]|uniref:Uncharacterized protein n=2 Tax=Glycine subgen. Soja TaxID=1462606 RepID=A0A0R0JSR4_SOYBN|nr:hypothetical protein JHK87_012277 [Glycine soja]KAG5040238.1 hypothetical protein JHK85_012714 [Glycine max]KAG5057383.1 hypothetical protein JHK86_012379 [Glycine max]KAG5154389.1 hypothetical protein JHK82_012358 [Glycine max]KAH1133563.1 hypothetical protein GYH30_012103 [Glycine max]